MVGPNPLPNRAFDSWLRLVAKVVIFYNIEVVCNRRYKVILGVEPENLGLWDEALY